jgi:rhamnogalacturonan endolyase
MQIYFGHEWKQTRDGLCLVDARTGKTIWGYGGPTIHIHSTGMVADIDPTRPGMEMYGGEANGTQFWLYDARGVRLGNKPMAGLAPKAVWWADGPTKVVVAGNKMFYFKPPTEAEVAELQEITMRATAADVVRNLTQPKGPAKVTVNELWPGYIGETIGGLQGTVVAIADCMGDWREELIVSVAGEIRIYSTTIPATTRRVCLMQDRQYRTSVARQTMGYFYPPILGRP